MSVRFLADQTLVTTQSYGDDVCSSFELCAAFGHGRQTTVRDQSLDETCLPI